jgi:cyanophycinase
MVGVALAALLSMAMIGASGHAPNAPKRGYLFIVGGGPQPPELVQRFVYLAGGKNAKIVVFAMASSDGKESGEEKAEDLRKLGADAHAYFIGPDEANSDSMVKHMEGVTGVGIDESTALIVHPDGHWSVLGESAASIYDARRAAITRVGAPVLGESGLILSVLPAGSSYYPATGKVVLPH